MIRGDEHLNIASYALLTHMAAQAACLSVGDLIVLFGDFA